MLGGSKTFAQAAVDQGKGFDGCLDARIDGSVDSMGLPQVEHDAVPVQHLEDGPAEDLVFLDQGSVVIRVAEPLLYCGRARESVRL